MSADTNSAPRPKPLREQAREAVRAAILGAAEKRFGEQGYQATKMAQIASDAGVAAGTLYNYFANKEAVFDEIIRIQGENSFGAIEEEVAKADSPLEAIRALVEALLGAIESQRHLYSILVEIQVDLDSTIRKTAPGSAAHELRLRFGRLAADVVNNAQASGELGSESSQDLLSALLGICNGFLSTWIHSRQGFQLTEKAPVITRIFLDGVRQSGHR